MTGLTRRRDPDSRSECWHVYYGDVQIGTIGKRVGVPNDVDQWGWQCGFYAPSHNGRHVDGTAATFDRARNEFEAAWASYLPDCTEAAFQAYRAQRDWTARKYAMWERRERLPSQQPNSMMRCVCGTVFDRHRPEESLSHRQHIYAKHQVYETRR
jgi:hypothetical protein